jgi:hypothetical protein
LVYELYELTDGGDQLSRAGSDRSKVVLANTLSALFGAIVGGIITWHVSRRLAFLERGHTSIERACGELQHYRVVYAQYYVEYLSEYAREAGRDWTRLAGKQPDMNRLELEHRVDASRGRLRVHQAILKRVLPREAVVTADKMISLILQESSCAHQVDCMVIDERCDSAMDVLLTALPRK